jgi:heme-degrading monooxygenase HmoA
MIVTLVQFEMSPPVSLADATQRFESSAPKYQNLAGLIRKHYVRSEDGRRVGGIYIWNTREDAERVFSGEWRERVAKLYGGAPSILWFDTPVTVDNAAGGTITKAA